MSDKKREKGKRKPQPKRIFWLRFVLKLVIRWPWVR
jgi:hypothetical protein